MANQARRGAAVAALGAVCVLAAATAWAAPGRIQGQVTEADGRPIPGVAVTSGAASAVTAPGGLYALEGVSAGGRVVVTFAKDGYATTYGAVDVPGSDDSDGDGIPDDKDRCPLSDLRPTVTIDGCDTGLGNRVVRGCSAMDVFLDCAEAISEHAGHGHARGRFSRCGGSKEWYLLGCLAQPKFLWRVDNLTWRTLKRAKMCVRKARFPLEELENRPTPPSADATLHRTLPRLGAVRTLDAAVGGTVESGGSRVSFPQNVIAATGPVDAALTALDVAGPDIGAFPGDFRAIDRAQRAVLLETWGLVNVGLAQGGSAVSLRAAASVEILLPPGAPYQAGSRVALWWFDPASGLWREQASATAIVQASSTTPGRLAAFGPVDRTGWWNVDLAVTVSCLSGRVEDARGLPVEGALVTATGLDHFGVASARSDADGSYCVETRIGSRVAVRASAVVDGLRLDSPPVELTAPPTASLCADGACGIGPVLALPGVSCVCGAALDELGHPRAGVAVATSAGSAAVTGVDGRYCLAAPAEQVVTVFGEGYAPVAATTLPGGSCPDGCVVADLAPPPPTPGAACLEGTIVGPTDFTTIDVRALDASGQLLAPVPVGPDGRWSVGGLPAESEVTLRITGPDCEQDFPVQTGPAGPACTVAPEIRTACGF